MLLLATLYYIYCILHLLSVTFNDDDPRKGFSTVFLTVPELAVNKRMFGLRKAAPRNAEISPEFHTG